MKNFYSQICLFIIGFGSVFNVAGHSYYDYFLSKSDRDVLESDVSAIATDFYQVINNYEQKQ